MLSLFKKVSGIFSIYVHPIEKKLERLFNGLGKNANALRIRRRLRELMQENMVVIQLWCERRYKGYKDLDKKRRKELIQRATGLAKEFEVYVANKKLQHKPMIILQAIGSFLHDEKDFVYEEGSYFANLLKDSQLKTLKGDCNQMVSLYVFLYSRFCDIDTLSLKLFPGHVCLHYKGIDIETTNGKLLNYKKPGEKVKPIEELIVVNLIDIDDEKIKRHDILDDTSQKAHLLHFLLGTHTEMAQHNLEISQQKEWIKLYKSLGVIKTVTQLKAKKEVILKMKKIAQELGNKEWLEWSDRMLKLIK